MIMYTEKQTFAKAKMRVCVTAPQELYLDLNLGNKGGGRAQKTLDCRVPQLMAENEE